jgi:methylated-DNA-[protein]-cysteine S-methyltransferase
MSVEVKNGSRYICHYQSPLGLVRLVSDGARLMGLYLPAQVDLAVVASESQSESYPFDAAKEFLDQYFSSANKDLKPPPLCLRGTSFQVSVWTELLRIALGKTSTYGEIANAIGRPMASRAVGKAIGDNPISIIVPCHRVIGRSGALTGYAGGLPAKRWLLDHEGVFTVKDRRQT